MHTTMKTRFTSAIVAVCLTLGMAPTFAGGTNHGPTTRSTKVFQQVLKTDNLRILSLELAPGEFLDYHATPDQAAYAATEGTLRTVAADGTVSETQVKAGDRLWIDLTNFKNWNTGTKTLKIMLLEQPTEDAQKILNNYLVTR
jgi:quercetin dioxygenase-like cupin family protein